MAAYIYQLLEKLEPELTEELKEQKMEQQLRRREARSGLATQEDVARAWTYAPPRPAAATGDTFVLWAPQPSTFGICSSFQSVFFLCIRIPCLYSHNINVEGLLISRP